MPLWLRSALTTILFPGLVAGVAPFWIARSPWALAVRLGMARWIGLLLLLAGVWALFQTIRAFAVLGRGTLAPWDAPEHLVQGHIYRWVRNPMYLGVLSIIAGQALLWESAGALLYGALIALAFHVRVVAFEEPALRGQFGEAYAEYVRTVPRWLPRRRTGAIPRGAPRADPHA